MVTILIMGMRAGIALHLPLVGHLGRKILDEGDVRAGAAHVKGNDLVAAALPADIAAAITPADGPDTAVLMGLSVVSLMEMIEPLDCVT